MTEAGHCYSFITALCRIGDPSQPIVLWASRHAKLTFKGANVTVRKHFFRRIRRWQSYFLYKRLLRAPGKVFVSTAGHTDMLLLDWASSGVIAPNKVTLYVHWFNASARKLASLKSLARKQPNLEIYGPTASVVKVFQEAGFVRARIVPYPISRRATNHSATPQPFRHLLYAGAARRDKGFSHIVDLVAHLHKFQLEIPVLLQTSAEHFGKLGAAIEGDLARLQAIGYAHLQQRPDTLNAGEYADLYRGAVCLQLYDSAAFADRISGVTLDAFSEGCPVVSTADSWIARMVQRFDAGQVVDTPAPHCVLAAVRQQIAQYAHYQGQARAAGDILQDENSAGTLYGLLAN